MSDEDGVSSSIDPVVVTTVGMVPPGNTDDLDELKTDLQIENEAITQNAILTLNSTATLQMPPSLTNPTLQSLLASPISLSNGQLLGHPEGIQIIAVSSPSDLLPTQTDTSGRIWHVINPETAIIVGDPTDFEQKPIPIVNAGGDGLEDNDSVISTGEMMVPDTVSGILIPPLPQLLPPDCPSWATRLKNCEKIGDYYRGYVDSEVELDLLLTYHKQQTQSFWGTRQSPSQTKPSTRLMWKSQYVPWDGVPFVNSRSRAVVMECQYGPRRKGNLSKKQVEEVPKNEYRQTCPARIYIKKVRKFPEFGVDVTLEKKSMKNAMDKAFHELKMRDLETMGQERYYVQLPTEKAHEFHEDSGSRSTPQQQQQQQQQQTTQSVSPSPQTIHPQVTSPQQDLNKSNRLNPQVVQKIRELVAGGETRVYAIRKQLRAFVCSELCSGNDLPIKRHDLTLFPTVNDLKNQIHQALKDIENGSLALTAPQVNVELVTGAVNGAVLATGEERVNIVEQAMFQQQVVAAGQGPVPETVTVTLTQNPGEDGFHVISRIETHLSDGTTQISTTLTPETAQLLTRLNPSMFSPSSLVQLQAAAQAQQTNQENADDSLQTESISLSEEPKLESTGEPDTAINIHVQEAVDQSDDTGSLQILETEDTDSPHMMTEDNASISEQSEEFIMPAVTHDLDELPEPSDTDL